MADHYTQFSVGIRVPSPEAKEWLLAKFEEIKKREEAENGLEELGFDFQFQTDEVEGTYIWCHDQDGSANLELFIEIFTRYLKKFSPKTYIHLTWSNSCSKPQLNAFGGGLAIITAYDVHTFDEWDWAKTKTKKLEMANVPG